MSATPIGPIPDDIRALLEDVVNDGEQREEFMAVSHDGILRLPDKRRQVYARLRLAFGLTDREPEVYDE